MRKFLTSLILVLVLVCSSNVWAGEIAQGMGDRAVRGVRNLFTGIIEWPMQISKGYKNGVSFIENDAGSKAVGTVLGFFRGISHAGGRMSSGAVELFGFWAASPEDNIGVGVPLDAEYAWEQGEQYSIFEPSLEEGVKPWFRKLGRGIGNGLLGIAEVPGQIKKGVNDGDVVVGVVKGFWYWGSREVYGFNNIMTSFVPNPKDNLGTHFDEKWPWDALSQ